jgi:hypothetical protein
MPDVAKLKEMRFRYLNRLYEVTGGDQMARADMHKIAKELGLSDQEKNLVTQYLSGEGLLEHATIGGGIAITHYGVREIEAAHSEPESPTHYFPPVNLISVHTMSNSQITQASPGSEQTFGSEELGQLRDFVAKLLEDVDKLQLGNEDRSELESDASTLQSQADSSRPKKSIIAECLRSIQRVLEGAAGGVAASQLLPYIPALLEAFR